MKGKAVKICKLAVAGFDYLLWTPKCRACGVNLDENDYLFCRRCWQKLSACCGDDFCPSCGAAVSRYALIDDKCPKCQDIDFTFDKIAVIGHYDGLLRELIINIKHNESPKMVSFLSSQLFSSVKSSLPIEKIDCFTAVPLHWRRRLYRGYNQSHLLLETFKKDGLAVRNLLRRCRHTLPQPGLTYAQRLKNIQGAFVSKQRNYIKDKRICIIDDIKTTGATLSECGKVLKQSGAQKVYAAVIASAK